MNGSICSTVHSCWRITHSPQSLADASIATPSGWHVGASASTKIAFAAAASAKIAAQPAAIAAGTASSAAGMSTVSAFTQVARALSVHFVSFGFFWTQPKTAVVHLLRLFSFFVTNAAPVFLTSFWHFSSDFPTSGSVTLPSPPKF